MREAVICEPLRTAVGGFGGVYRDVPVSVLASTVIAELVQRTSLPGEAVDDVVVPELQPVRAAAPRRAPAARVLRSGVSMDFLERWSVARTARWTRGRCLRCAPAWGETGAAAARGLSRLEGDLQKIIRAGEIEDNC